MDYYTKWPEVYAISNREASIVAEALVTNVFDASTYRGSYIVNSVATSSLVLYRIFAKPWSKQDAHNTLAPAIGRHGRALHQSSREAHKKGRRFEPEGMRLKIIHLSPGLQGIHSLY
jgi:hypothetical protein